MAGKSQMEMLEAEHHVIRKIVGAMAVLAEGLGAGQEPPVETLRNIVEFMRTFADKCHHGKEEAHLFPFLEKRGVPARGCPIGVLIHEYKRGRTLVAQLAQAIDAYVSGTVSARDSVTEPLRGLMELYPSHIWKEKYGCYPKSVSTCNVWKVEAHRGTRLSSSGLATQREEAKDRCAWKRLSGSRLE
jgi:hemerythrin-like domain-containing protein